MEVEGWVGGQYKLSSSTGVSNCYHQQFFLHSPNYLSWQPGRQLTTGCKTHSGPWGFSFLSSINIKTLLSQSLIAWICRANLSVKMWYLIWSGASSKCNRRSLWWPASSYIYCSPQTLRDKLYHKLLPTNQPTFLLK